jgi:FdhD protein
MTSLRKVVTVVDRSGIENIDDQVAVEEPLQILLRKPGDGIQDAVPFSVTMRTPGNDKYLVLGLLFSEGLISRMEEVIQFESKGPGGNLAYLFMNEDHPIWKKVSERMLLSNSACGVCGKASLDFMEDIGVYIHSPGRPQVHTDLLFPLIEGIKSEQGTFDKTGGVHAAVLCNPDGEIIKMFEDVGRHNAMDKLVGWGLESGTLPFDQHFVLFSGRTSFELIQKAHNAGLNIVASIGAPSSLAIELAEENGITLVGFLKKERFNIYHDLNRLIHGEEVI